MKVYYQKTSKNKSNKTKINTKGIIVSLEFGKEQIKNIHRVQREWGKSSTIKFNK